MNGWQIGLLILVVILLAGFGGWWARGERIISNTDTLEVIRIDTVKFEKIVYRNLPAKHDTVFVETGENRIVSYVDTVFAEHDDVLRVEYLHPEDSFNIFFTPGPRIVEIKDSIIYIPKPYAVETVSMPWVVGSVAVGIGLGVLLSK